MQSRYIVTFAQLELEAVTRYRIDGNTYRCAAYLRDGVYLPCVLLSSRERRVEWAVRNTLDRLEDSKKPPETRRFGHGMGMPNLVALYAASDNRVQAYDIARLEPSPYAIPMEQLQGIKRETSMSWTQFVATMVDGTEAAFGASGYYELFYEMPDGYTGKDIVAVRPHETLPGKVWGDKPFFTCYVDGLDS
jgi:hypothetical protein